MALPLVELDELLITVIVDNEVDPMSIYRTPGIEASNRFIEVGLVNGTPVPDRGGHASMKEMALSSLCCGAHGLSLLITAVKGDQRRSMLFDTGPEEMVWKLNASRLKPDLRDVDVVHLSHWHRDHSGGMLEAIRQIKSAKVSAAVAASSTSQQEVLVDLHPYRPDYRGIDFPGAPLSLEADPTFEEVEAAGGTVDKHDEAHTALNDMFLTSGFIPRVTPYEVGLKLGMRFDKSKGVWESDELVADERFVMCNVKNKGLVVFTGCSHAGVVNVSKHAIQLAPNIPLHAIIGGYHLADDMDPNLTKTKATVADLKALNPQVLVPGHCSGWRVKQMIENEMPGRLAPCTVGTKFRFGEPKENLKGRTSASGMAMPKPIAVPAAASIQ